MVFRVFLALILILGQVPCTAQIDNLKTPDEVVRFVHKVAPDYGSISSKFGSRRISNASFDSLVRADQLRPIEKVDLDGNGLTDLIFNGSSFSYSNSDSFPQPLSLAILSFEKDSFCVRDLSLDRSEDIVANSLLLDGRRYIRTIRATLKYNGDDYRKVYYIDTLDWQFNAFIERKPPVKRKVERIDYIGWNGLAFMENMTLRIIGDSVRLKKERFEGFDDLNRGGVYLTRLDSNIDNRLYGLLDAIDFVQLKDSFDVGGSDATTGSLKIRYDDGQEKLITDYGLSGTYGLAALHQLLFGLIGNQRWINSDAVASRCIDSLHSDREVLALVRTLDTEYPFLDFEPEDPVNAVHDYRERLIAFGQQKWQKGDFDSNGYTDLLFNGYSNKNGDSRQTSVVVLSFRGGSLHAREISGATAFFAARVTQYKHKDVLQINYQEVVKDTTQKKGYHLTSQEDTLTFYDGQLVEIPPTKLHHIQRLSKREETSHDSVIVTAAAIYWYKNDAPIPEYPDTAARKDSINLYMLADQIACQKLLSLAGGLRFERLNPELLLPDESMRFLSSTWCFRYDGGKQTQWTSEGGIGSYRLEALDRRLWQAEHERTGWKLIPRPSTK